MIRISWSTESTRTEPTGGDTLIEDTGEILCDILDADNYEMSADVTAHVVESGAPVTDHINVKQDRITLNLMISDSPMLEDLGATMSSLELPSGASVSVYQTSGERATSLFRTLQGLHHAGILIDVDGARLPIEGWAITMISSPRKAEDSGALLVDLDLVQVRTATYQEIEAPAPRVERGRPSSDEGREGAEEGTDDTASSNPEDRREALTSAAHSLLSLGRGR